MSRVIASIDLSSDLGEGAGTDAALMPLITSASIACGGHAGNDHTMRMAVDLALLHKVAIGAHPGYPDRQRFGRVALAMEPGDLVESIRRQIDALVGIADRYGAKVHHVKAHGALYNQAERDPAVARTVVAAIQSAGGRDLLVFAPAGSAMEEAAKRAGLRVAREGFIDRAYEPDGTLRSRALPDALVTNPAQAARQALSFVRDGGVTASDGSFLRLAADTLCVHGDTPGAVDIMRSVRDALRTVSVGVATVVA